MGCSASCVGASRARRCSRSRPRRGSAPACSAPRCSRCSCPPPRACCRAGGPRGIAAPDSCCGVYDLLFAPLALWLRTACATPPAASRSSFSLLRALGHGEILILSGATSAGFCAFFAEPSPTPSRALLVRHCAAIGSPCSSEGRRPLRSGRRLARPTTAVVDPPKARRARGRPDQEKGDVSTRRIGAPERGALAAWLVGPVLSRGCSFLSEAGRDGSRRASDGAIVLGVEDALHQCTASSPSRTRCTLTGPSGLGVLRVCADLGPRACPAVRAIARISISCTLAVSRSVARERRQVLDRDLRARCAGVTAGPWPLSWSFGEQSDRSASTIRSAGTPSSRSAAREGRPPPAPAQLPVGASIMRPQRALRAALSSLGAVRRQQHAVRDPPPRRQQHAHLR